VAFNIVRYPAFVSAVQAIFLA
jgi:hypothetical protein